MNKISFLADIKSRTVLKGEFYEKNGEKYVKYTYIDLKADVGGGHVQLGNLFGGDKILSESQSISTINVILINLKKFR